MDAKETRFPREHPLDRLNRPHTVIAREIERARINGLIQGRKYKTVYLTLNSSLVSAATRRPRYGGRRLEEAI